MMLKTELVLTSILDDGNRIGFNVNVDVGNRVGVNVNVDVGNRIGVGVSRHQMRCQRSRLTP